MLRVLGWKVMWVSRRYMASIARLVSSFIVGLYKVGGRRCGEGLVVVQFVLL